MINKIFSYIVCEIKEVITYLFRLFLLLVYIFVISAFEYLFYNDIDVAINSSLFLFFSYFYLLYKNANKSFFTKDYKYLFYSFSPVIYSFIIYFLSIFIFSSYELPGFLLLLFFLFYIYIRYKIKTRKKAVR